MDANWSSEPTIYMNMHEWTKEPINEPNPSLLENQCCI